MLYNISCSSKRQMKAEGTVWSHHAAQMGAAVEVPHTQPGLRLQPSSILRWLAEAPSSRHSARDR